MSFRNASPPHAARPLSLGGLVLAFGAAAPYPCRAAEPCDLELSGPDTPAWRDAVAALELGSTKASDCSTLHLALGPGTARLTYVTKDGRTAERDLREPSELAPTVDALLVTGLPSPPEPAPAPEPPADPPPTLTVRPLARPQADALARSPSEPATSGSLTAAFTLQLGVRGGAQRLASPLIYAALTMDRSRWELGVGGALEPEDGFFGAPGDTRSANANLNLMPGAEPPVPLPPAGDASAAAVGITAGRRFPFTHLEAVWSARLGIAALRRFDGANDATELRTGSALDLVFPRNSTLHFRTGLGVEIVPNARAGTGPATIPWWALSGRLGLEVGGT